MHDTYLKSQDRAALEAFCSAFRSFIGPAPGRSAVPASGVEGEPDYSPAQPATGDPAYWYACIRTPAHIDAVDGVEIIDVEDGTAVVGVWSE